MRPSTLTLFFKRCAAVAVITAGCVAVPMAGAQNLGSAQGSVDNVLAAGQPGPHRVMGNYFTSPTAPAAQLANPGVALVGPSTPIVVDGEVCTVAVSGTDAQGRKIAITAGHCGHVGAPVSSMDAPDAGVIGHVARIVARDVAVIELTGKVNLTRSYNNVTINDLGGRPPAVLEGLCKTGVATGTSCGPTLSITPNSIMAHLCGSFGDSGAPIFAGNRLVGVLNGGVAGLPSCTTPLQGPLHAPTVGTPWSSIAPELNAGGVGAGFRLA